MEKITLETYLKWTFQRLAKMIHNRDKYEFYRHKNHLIYLRKDTVEGLNQNIEELYTTILYLKLLKF